MYMDELTAEEARTLTAILEHDTRTAAAKALGISRSALYARLQSPLLREAERAARGQALSDATNRLHNGAARVVNVLLHVAEDPNAPASARVAAANHYLSLAYKTYYDEDLENRLRALEAELAT